MPHGHGQHACRDALPFFVNPRRAAQFVDDAHAGHFTVQEQHGVFATRVAVGREHGAQAPALVHGAGVVEAQRAGGADGGAGAAAHAQVRLDDDAAAFTFDVGVGLGAANLAAGAALAFERGVAADGLRGAHVDAGTAANLLVAAVRANLGLVAEETRLFEFTAHLAQRQHRAQQRGGVLRDVEIALRLGVHGEGGRLAQVEHEVEVLGHLLRRAVEVDRARSAAHAHAVAVAFASVQVDLVAEVDGAFGASVDAGVAAGAQVQIDGVAAVPFGVEGAEPALQLDQPASKGGAAVGLRDRAALCQHRDVELVFQHRSGTLGGLRVTQHQQAAARAVADSGHRLGCRQLRSGDQGGDLWRGGFGVARPAAGFANVHEVDRPLLHAGGTVRLLVKFEE